MDMARITALMITKAYLNDDNNSDSVADESKAESEIVPDSSAENTDSEGADSVE